MTEHGSTRDLGFASASRASTQGAGRVDEVNGIADGHRSASGQQDVQATKLMLWDTAAV